MKRLYAIILASGTGERIKSQLPKQFIKIAGKTVVEYSIEAFENNKYIDEIIIVIHPLFRKLMEDIILRNKYKKVNTLLNGGQTRRESSCIGINSIEDENSIVLIHDAARPLVSDKIINDCKLALEKHDAVAVCIQSTDTIVNINDSMLIRDIPKRKYVMRAQTPQGFKTGLIKKAHMLARNNRDMEVTDDAGLILEYKLADVYVVTGEERNIKITYQEDIFLANKFFEAK